MNATGVEQEGFNKDVQGATPYEFSCRKSESIRNLRIGQLGQIVRPVILQERDKTGEGGAGEGNIVDAIQRSNHRSKANTSEKNSGTQTLDMMINIVFTRSQRGVNGFP